MKVQFVCFWSLSSEIIPLKKKFPLIIFNALYFALVLWPKGGLDRNNTAKLATGLL